MSIGDKIVLPKIGALYSEEGHMKIEAIEIKNVSNIRQLKLTFNDRMNVICGANGVGKTSIINSICSLFSYQPFVKRTSDCENGSIDLTYLNSNVSETKRIRIKQFEPTRSPESATSPLNSKEVIYFTTFRQFDYMELSNLPRNKELNNYNRSTRYEDNSEAKKKEVKEWFVKRYLFSAQKGALPHEALTNYNTAIEIFSFLGDGISFSKVNYKNYDILMNTPTGEIYFEYLSSGYKSCFYILLGILKDIEYNNSEKGIIAQDFEGVILIDEIDLHLHPSWQVQLVEILKKVFSKAQFIVTTHSPSILQALEKEEIIPLKVSEDGNVYNCMDELNLGEYGLQGWTLEEILTDVMGVSSVSSSLYKDTIRKFSEAMDGEEKEQILCHYHKLKKMLHSESSMQTLLDIQTAEWRD